MAEQKSRIYSLPEVTEINDDMYLMLDASDTGARRFNLKTFYDKVDGVQASADAANTAATAAAAAVDSANQAAQQAANAAESASTTVQGLVEDVNEAIEAVGDVTELAVPTMSPTVKGGAKLGTGLEVTDGTLSVNTTASGDGSQAGPILSLSAKGRAEQDTTTGKNLLIGSKDVISITSTELSWYDIEGNAAASRASKKIPISIGSTYTFRAEFTNAMGAQLVCDNGSGSVSLIQSVTSGSVYTFVARYDNVWFRLNIPANQVSVIRNAQLELGSTATAYEPYTGGAPSPSPDYAQEIRVARGRNLLNLTRRVDGVDVIAVRMSDVSVNNQVLTFTATSSDAYYGAAVNQGSSYTAANGTLIPVEPNTTYSISWTNPAFNMVIVSEFDESKVSLDYTSKTAPTSFTTKASTRYVVIRVGISNATTGTTYSTAVQLEKGSVATPYVPYGYVGLEAQKNLLPNTATSQTTRGVTFTVNADGSVTANGTATATIFFKLNFAPVVCDAGTYTISDGGVGDITRGSAKVYNDGDGLDSSGPKTTTITGQKTWLFYIRITSDYTCNNLTFYPMLNKGTTALPYEPYYHTTTPIPLPSRGWVGSLPDGTADVLTLDGAGKVVWEKACEEYTLDGSETIGNSANTSGNPDFPRIAENFSPIPAPPVITNKTYKDQLWSHYVTANPYSSSRTGIAWLYKATNDSVNATVRMTYPNGISTVEDFKTWLSTHSVTVLYPLATPVTEDSGYIEMPEVPVGAEISIPELDDIGVKYCIDASARDLAMMWYDRARGEYADRLDGLDDDLVDTYGEIISANARIDTVGMDEDYDRQVLNGTYAGRNIITVLGVANFDAAVAQMHTLAQSRSAGNLRLGDYIDVTPTSNTVNKGQAIRYRIAGIGHCYGFGDTTVPWAFWMVPDNGIDMTRSSYAINTSYIYWNTTADNNGNANEHHPYLASNLHAWELGEFLPALPTALQNVLVNHRILFEERYSASGKLEDSTGWSWGDAGKVFSLSETEVYGQCVWGTKGYSVGSDVQLPLFALAPWRRLSGSRVSRWLRSVRSGSASYVCHVGGGGNANNGSATYTGAQPWSCILIG